MDRSNLHKLNLGILSLKEAKKKNNNNNHCCSLPFQNNLVDTEEEQEEAHKWRVQKRLPDKRLGIF